MLDQQTLREHDVYLRIVSRKMSEQEPYGHLCPGVGEDAVSASHNPRVAVVCRPHLPFSLVRRTSPFPSCTKMDRRIDCGFFILVPRSDFKGMRRIREMHEETMQTMIKSIQDQNERERELRFRNVMRLLAPEHHRSTTDIRWMHESWSGASAEAAQW